MKPERYLPVIVDGRQLTFFVQFNVILKRPVVCGPKERLTGKEALLARKAAVEMARTLGLLEP